MADIQLTADGSQAIATLKKIQVSVDALSGQFKKFASDASKSLDGVKRNTDALSDATDNLKSAIVGLGLASIITGFMNYAKEVKGASNATGVAVSTIDNFAKAVGRAGGDTNRAVGDVIDFVAQLNEAKQGSAGAQAELANIGVTLKDLSTLSNEDIFKKTVEGLAKMEDASMRNALAVKYLGRNFKDIDVKEVAGGMGSGKDNTAAIESAAAAMKNFNVVISGFKAGVISAIAPITQFFGSLDKETVSKIGELAGKLGTLATVLIGMSGLFKVLATVAASAGVVFGGLAVATSIQIYRFTAYYNIIKQAIAGTVLMGTAGGTLAGTTVVLSGAFEKFVFIIGQTLIMLKNFAKYLLAMAGPIAALIAGLYTLNEVIAIAFGVDILGEFFGWLGKIWNKIKDILGLKSSMPDETDAETKRLKEQNGQYDAQGKKIGTVIDGQRAIAIEAQKTVDAYRQQGLMAARSLGISISLIGVDADRAAQIQKLADLETGYLTEKNNLEQKYIDMKRAAAGGTAEEQQAFAAFASVYKKTLSDIDAAYAEQKTRMEALLNVETVLKAREQERLNNLEEITKAMERQAALGDALRGANDKMVDIKFQASQRGKSPFAQQIAQINEEARKAALEAGRVFAAGFEDGGDGLSPEKAAELENGLKKIAKRYKEIADAQIENLEASRTFNAGWKEAFNQYLDDASNAAKIAGDEFRAMAGVINNAIDTFVDKGEFSFSGFAKSIIAEFAKIELKAATMNLLGSMGLGDVGGSGGGILSGLLGGAMNSLFGSSARGQSANSPLFVKDVSNGLGTAAGAVKSAMGGEGLLSKAWGGVKSIFGFGDKSEGESSGGIMDSITGFGGSIANTIGGIGSSISDSVGSLFGGGSSEDSGGGFMDTLGSVASSIGDMFGGWFAEGGKPPLGKASIVGENGPELFMPNSAGTIIPNGAFGGGGGGQSITNVTNNISALDAKSVAQLLAENKTMIFGIVEQARKGMPSRG